MTDNMINERIENFDITNEMQTSFLEYAYSVIYARALPDARDGLKPVQRRIIFQMSQMNLYPDRPYVKSARVVGDVMGKLHPHGDSAIYDAMVRLAQDFSLRSPLVDGHGNFGSLDDGPAAARYTEARMTPVSVAMCSGIDEDVVDFVPNYDNKLMQPDVLPSQIPNLLVNGGTGIAVGMATNMIPHNLKEVIQAAVFLVKNPDCTIDDLMKFVPGPDLPTGGKIVGLEPIKEAYQTGRGIVQMRCKAQIEKVTAKKQGIVITELPYTVGPEKVIEKIADSVKNHKIDGISNVVDLTDRKNGLKIVIEIKNGFNPNAILKRLYKLTPLQESFGINNVALVNGAPKTLGLKELLEVWIGHRMSVVRRQTEFRLRAKNDRLHLVEGLLIAILDIDEVIQLIRSSDDTPQASSRLQSVFDLSETQANYILDLRLRRLTKFSKIELETEKEQLLEEIRALQEILSSKESLENEVCSQMLEISRLYGDERRTELVDDDGSTLTSSPVSSSSKSAAPSGHLAAGVTADLLQNFNQSSDTNQSTKSSRTNYDENLQIQDSPCYVLLSATGHVARCVRGNKEEQYRPPLIGSNANEDDSIQRGYHDAIAASIKTTTRSYFGVLTSHGRILLASPVELPEIARGVNHDGKLDTNTQGMPKLDKLEIAGLENGIDLRLLVQNQLQSTEHPVTIVELSENEQQLKTARPLAIGTTLGVVKRVKPEIIPHDRSGNFHFAWNAISLQDGDSIVGAAMADDDSELVFISSDSSLLHFPALSVRPQGLSGGGMAGIRLADGERVVFFGVLDKAQIENKDSEPLVFTVAGDSAALAGTENGFAKLTPFNLYPGKGRGTGGVRSQKFLKGQNCLIYAWAGQGAARANTISGVPVSLPEIDIRRDGSGKLLDHPICAVG